MSTATSTATTRAASRALCIPVTYTTPAGHYMLAYPRSPWDARLYQVVDCTDSRCESDVLCTVDDFGDLAVTHRRNPLSLMGMGFKRVAHGVA